MEMDLQKGRAFRSLVRRLCFMAIGIGALANPLDLFNPINIGFGILWGLIFGGLFRVFLKGFLGMFNGQFKKENGKEAIRYAVDNGMLFLTPFTLILLIAVFYLGWSMTIPFISAGIMAVGTASSIEMGKMLGKPGIKNTIATAGVSFVFSLLWTLSFSYLNIVPSYLEGGVNLVRSIAGGGGL
ncbi:hypothetical protein [Phosphitispora fastidiosa]|uniref:hypothetical protein n=1 Tax=Phosphitispora fastidiosa TaxID=2837202 RepID=UPI001E5739D1|nr:hypothetical protein [Phosphitispora fastidiosa]MBU7006562.1 hypothetical protein [Phosphitispora fastidiosa]